MVKVISKDMGEWWSLVQSGGILLGSWCRGQVFLAVNDIWNILIKLFDGFGLEGVVLALFFESQMPGRGKGNKIVGINLSKKHLYLDYH